MAPDPTPAAPFVPETFVLDRIEPVTYRGQHYGDTFEFRPQKAHCKLTSRFHAPAYLSFSQIESATIRNDHKRKMLWWGLATLLLFVGILILVIRVQVPNWKIELRLKKEKKPVTILAWLPNMRAEQLADFLTPHLSQVEFRPTSSKPRLGL
jgi:hypothetical protein